MVSGIGPERSVCQGWQVDGGIIAQGSDGFQGQITGALDGPLVILLEKNGADEASDGVFVRKDADDIRAAFNFRRSRGLTEWILVQCSLGKVM